MRTRNGMSIHEQGRPAQIWKSTIGRDAQNQVVVAPVFDKIDISKGLGNGCLYGDDTIIIANMPIVVL